MPVDIDDIINEEKEGNEKKEWSQELIGQQIVKKSNTFIVAKYKSTLLENQIVSLALTRLKIDTQSKCPVAEFFSGEIKDMLGRNKDSNIYKKLKRASESIVGHVISIENGKGDFKVFSMITNAEYIDGIFKIQFNKEMTPLISNLSGDYTSYELSNVTGFKSDYSYRIYELLKKETYRINPALPNDRVSREFGLSELKAMIGVVNVDEVAVRKAINAGKNWDDIVENIAVEKQFKDWYEFRRQVLDKAKKELEEKTDIKFDYITRRAGGGGKVKKITFVIQLNDPSEHVVEKMQNQAKAIRNRMGNNYKQLSLEDYDLSDSLKKYVGWNKLTERHLKDFLQMAEYDEGRVIKAIQAADKQPYIKNYVGWINSCIMNKFEEPIEVISGSNEKAEAYNTYVQNKEMNEEQIASRVWNRMKEKPEYKDFIVYLEEHKFSEEMIEILYTPTELVQEFIKWKKGEEPF